MGFFTRKQKKYAKHCSVADLQQAYRISEQNLIEASRSGDIKHLKTAMKQHANFEYALLYKHTPEYRKSIKRIRRK